jgi:hypothetical protein
VTSLLYAKFQVHSKFARDVGTKGGRWGTRPLQFLADHSSLSQLGDQIVPSYNLKRPPRFSDLPTLLLLSLGYKFRRLDPNLSGLAERAGMAASCLYQPSKGHRSNKKSLMPLNLSIFSDA